MPFRLKIFSALFILLLFTAGVYGQIFKTETGSLDAISGVLRYNIIFEFADDMNVVGYDSEKEFLNKYSKKLNKKERGAGDQFKKNWFNYRKDIFGPKFIQEFNYFNLKEKQVTVAPNLKNSEYTIVVRTTSIDPGASNFFFKKDAWLKTFIRIYRTGDPATILYATKRVDIHSEGANLKILERIMSAYAELGRGVAKHLSRKT